MKHNLARRMALGAAAAGAAVGLVVMAPGAAGSQHRRPDHHDRVDHGHHPGVEPAMHPGDLQRRRSSWSRRTWRRGSRSSTRCRPRPTTAPTT